MGLETRTKGTLAALVIALVAMPLAVMADDGPRLEAMESRLLALEDELKATRSALDHSEEMRQQGIPPEHLEQGSGLDNFLSGLEVGGFVEASLGKSADEPGSAGFQIDLLFGANNHILCGDPSVSITDSSGVDVSPGDINYHSNADDGVCVQEAYVSYNYNDIVFQMGKWETLLGYELIDAPYNNHVSHGLLFTWAIPLVHTGLLASGSFNENFGWAAGVVNGFNNATDTGDNKGVIGQLSYTEGSFFSSASAYVGSEEFRESSVNSDDGVPITNIGKNDQQVWIVDLVATYDPTDDMHLWLNADYGRLDRDSSTIPSTFGDSTREDPRWWGLASGFKYSLNEKVTLAGRGEYIYDDGGARFSSALLGPRSDTRMWTGTATVGYQFTSNLTARLEYRHDHISGTGGDPFQRSGDGFCLSGDCEDSLDVGIIEVFYQFD
jgi:hypothetical protein